MSILKTYYVQLRHFGGQRGDMRCVYVKARSLEAANAEFLRQYPDDYCEHTAELKSKNRKWRKSMYRPSPVFKSGLPRYGQYIYRHKGRKVKGRKNYPVPKDGWDYERPGATFTYVETINAPLRDFLTNWAQLLHHSLAVPELS